MIKLKAEPLTSERFAKFGDVVETSRGSSDPMNAARFERFDDPFPVSIQLRFNV